MIKIVSDIKPEEFDSKAHHPLQTWQWGEARKDLGTGVVRLVEYANGDLENVFQVSLHPIPYSGLRLGYIPRSVLPSKAVMEFLKIWGRNNKVVFFKFEPYVEKENSPRSFFTDPDLVRSTHPLFTDWTQMLDLTPPESEILSKMHHKTRYNLRLALKKGVVVEEANNKEGFEAFQKLYFETTRRQKYLGHDYRYHKTVWEHMKNGIAHILIAYYGNVPLAAYELFHFKKRLFYTYGGTSNEHRNLMASNLLMWETVRLGKKLGAEKLDMWGSLPPEYDQNNDWAGFTRFKSGYGTKFVEMVGSWDLVINPVLYKIYSLAYKAREFFLKLK
ncbi:MAG: lipid II:glycine glycyltransferase FemX [Patescibacteria group bacterium]